MTSATLTEELAGVAARAAGAGSDAALARWGAREGLEIEEKAASDDLVSEADREAEEAIREVIREHRPDDGIVGEEGKEVQGGSGVGWFVDPIDGTTNFLYGRPDWAVSVAAVSLPDRRVLAAAVSEPALGVHTEARLGGGAWAGGRRLRVAAAADLSRALVEVNFGRPDQRDRAHAMIGALVGGVRDVRRGGSAASALAQVADGRAEAYWGPGLRDWDTAAGILLVTEAGGVVGDLRAPGSSRAEIGSSDVLAAGPALWPKLQALLNSVY